MQEELAFAIERDDHLAGQVTGRVLLGRDGNRLALQDVGKRPAALGQFVPDASGLFGRSRPHPGLAAQFLMHLVIRQDEGAIESQAVAGRDPGEHNSHDAVEINRGLERIADLGQDLQLHDALVKLGRHPPVFRHITDNRMIVTLALQVHAARRRLHGDRTSVLPDEGRVFIVSDAGGHDFFDPLPQRLPLIARPQMEHRHVDQFVSGVTRQFLCARVHIHDLEGVGIHKEDSVISVFRQSPVLALGFRNLDFQFAFFRHVARHAQRSGDLTAFNDRVGGHIYDNLAAVGPQESHILRNAAALQ